MTVKKVTAPMSVQMGENTPNSTELKALPVATVKAEVKEPTPEELKKENELLKKKLSAIPQDLKSKVEYFNKKNELISRLSRLDANKEILSNHLDKLTEIGAANEFDNEEYSLNIEGGNKYNKSNIYTVKNPVIIGELLAFVMGRIDSKREALKKEIEA